MQKSLQFFSLRILRMKIREKGRSRMGPLYVCNSIRTGATSFIAYNYIK